jgi:MmyB-like transcription regulator ligand binding domain
LVADAPAQLDNDVDVQTQQPALARRLWGAHNVRTHGTGTKRLHHPDVGELVLPYEELAITA